MDQRRFILAIALITAIIILPSVLMRRPAPAPLPGADSVAAGSDTLATPVPQQAPPLATPAVTAPADSALALPATPEDTVVVSGELFRYGFSTRGATMVSAVLPHYAKTIPGHKEEQVDLVQPARPLFGLRLVVGSDTLSLTKTGGPTVTSSAVTVGPASGDGTSVMTDGTKYETRLRG